MAEEVTIAGTDARAKIRHAGGVFLLHVVTLGLYHLYWWYTINRELRDLGRERGVDLGQRPELSLLAVSPLAILTLYISYVWTVVTTTKRIQAGQRLAGESDVTNGWIALVLWIFTLGIGGIIYTQMGLNKVWRTRLEGPGPAAPTPQGADLERSRRRAERLAAEEREAGRERRRLILGYVVAGVLGAAVIGGIAIALAGGGGDGDGADAGDLPEAAHIELLSGEVNGFEPDDREGTPPAPIAQGDLEAAAKSAGCELQLELNDEGNAHVENADEAPEYKTDPPTSGDHIAQPRMQADGAYAEFVDPVYWVHSLEHGRIVIQYSPELPEEQQLELKGLFDDDPNGMLLFPNPEMKWDVAASAWTQLIGCPSYEGPATLDALRNFRDIYRGNGPEPVPTHLAG